MALWTAFLLGLVGSLHCAGMCGPLMLALPAAGGTASAYVFGRVIYHAGRLATYCLLGVLFALLGQTFAMAGVQRWLSIGLGLVMLASLLAYPKWAGARWLTGGVAKLKIAFGSLLRRKSTPALFLLGGLNGLLPCGLVYAACAGATTTGNVTAGIEYMLAFGLGTFPMMLALAFPGRALQARLVPRFRRLIPACLILMSALLVLRGLSLGIPLLSPKIGADNSISCCSKNPPP